MILRDLYATLKTQLSNVADDPALEARWLLQHFLALSDADILDGEKEVTPPQALDEAVQKRSHGMPLSKVLGLKAFYGRVFHTNPHVLDPRADSETLIDAALALPKTPENILELGVGSGCLVLTLLAEWPQTTATAIDISKHALDTAAQNAHQLQLNSRIKFLHSNWFENLPITPYDLIISNPPYIKTADIQTLDESVKDHDPLAALDGGADGLEAYKTILAGLKPYCSANAYILFEIGADQAADVTQLAQNYGFKLVAKHRDLGGHTRVLHFSLA